MSSKRFLQSVDLDWLKEAYFSNPEQRRSLKKGDVLMKQGEKNDKLYLILSGSLVAHLTNEEGNNFEVFRSTTDMFVGVYSFFSKTFSSYATILAEEDSELAFIDSHQDVVEDDECRTFVEHFMPIVVSEISARQLMAQRVAMEKENTLKKLLQTEKMATLGQMAAGLAHELNNAIGVLQRKTEWLSEEISEYLNEKDTKGMFSFFKIGLKKGQFLSSSDVRKRQKELQSKYPLDNNLAKKLAKTGLTDDELLPFKEEILEGAERMNYYWEIGSTFHDMLLASNHAVHVVKSVKQLGVANVGKTEDLDLNESIKEALSLLKSILRRVDLKLELGELKTISANSGELVQIWLNIIKNGCESMLNSKTVSPTILVKSTMKGRWINVIIEDNGPGIPDDLKDKIFQPSFTTKKDGLSFGLGLGLAIVQRLVENYSGKIGVESRPGKTTFKIKLPVS